MRTKKNLIPILLMVIIGITFAVGLLMIVVFRISGKNAFESISLTEHLKTEPVKKVKTLLIFQMTTLELLFLVRFP